jgi:hypothetical protein
MARTINSPGVQITEKDLSLRIQTPAGTQVFVPGFAPQGPTSEPLLITSISEFESIYGTPTTPAERYFYYSCKEILNSPATLNTIRLPYGPSAGADFASSYSILCYPMTESTGTWTIAAPFYYSLTQAEYNRIKQGDFTWDGTGGASTFGTTISINAGFFVLNDLQTVVNEVAEGYYIGFVDNTAVSISSPNFDSIKTITTLSGAEAFSRLSTDRIDFALSASKIDSDSGLGSISESLEKVGFIGFEGTAYNDHLSMGIFKLRRSTSDPSYLTLAGSETYLGSLDANRKVTSQSGGILRNAFVQDLVNNGSATIKMYVNPDVSTNYAWTVNSTLPTSRVTVGATAQGLFPVGVYTPDSLAVADNKQIGLVPLKLEKVLRTIENPENTVVDVLVDAGLSTIYSTNQYVTEDSVGAGSYDDETFVDAVSSIKDDWKAVVNVLINFSENTRKDCFTIIDPPRSVFVMGRDTKIIDVDGKTFTTDIYNPLRDCVDTIETNYAAVYGNWLKNADLFTGKKIWLPFSGYAACIFAKSDAIGNTWAAPAGFNRAMFNNALDIAFNPNQKQRDRLYEIAVNPVVYFSGDGYTIFGQKTLQNKPTAFDRINVRRLFLTLERAVQKTVKYFVFEPNTEFTRKRLINTIIPIFNYAKNTQGLYDFLIVSDDRNNTPDTIDNNELIVDIYIKPVRTAEFILVNFIATRTGQNFQELI